MRVFWLSLTLLLLLIWTFPGPSPFSGPVTLPAHATEGPQKPVLELFTSQGCSSCPPADALLQRDIARGDVLALSFSVDYWDRLGWKDTFASRANSERQRAYARSRGDGQVYTPQIVVNGRAHAVGSRQAEINTALIKTSQALKDERVALTAKLSDDLLTIHVGATHAGTQASSADVWLAAVQDRGLVDIKRGENANRKVAYHNVVREMRAIGVWNGEGRTFTIPRPELNRTCCQSVVVMVQAKDGGAILATRQVRLR